MAAGRAGRPAASERVSGDKVYFNRNFHIEPTNLLRVQLPVLLLPPSEGESRGVGLLPGRGRTDRPRPRRTGRNRSAYRRRRASRARSVLLRRDDPPREGDPARSDRQGLHGHRAVLHDPQGGADDRRRVASAARSAGMEAIPGGGAEIFDEELRARICPDKGSTAEWLEVHEAAHRLGIPTNATILYGHIECVEHRIDHLDRLRAPAGPARAASTPSSRSNTATSATAMSEVGEVSVIEDLRMLAMSRIYLDNIPPRQGLLGDVRQGDHRTGARLRGRRHRRHDRRYDENLLHGGGRRPASRA